MKKLILIGGLLGLLGATLLPIAVSADNCCGYSNTCCWQQCCAEQTYWYKVSYFERVLTGHFSQGVEMTTGVWTYQYVEAHDRDEAAEKLGLKAGYNCFINRALGYEEGK